MIIHISFKELLLSAISLQSPFNELYNIDKYIIKNIQKPLIVIHLRYFFCFQGLFCSENRTQDLLYVKQNPATKL